MILEQRKRNPGQGFQVVKTKKRLPINFDLASLNLMCNYVLTENRNVKRGQYINLRNLIEMLDMEKYINDQEKFKRIKFIKKGLEARLVKGLVDPIMIIKHINGGLLDSDIIDIETFVGMSNNEIDWINETISNALSSAFIYESVDYVLDLFTRFKTGNYSNHDEIVKEIETCITSLNTKFRKAKVEKSTDRTFSLKPDELRSILVDTYNELISEYRILQTGMQGFNQLIGGGFENTRLYLLVGATAAGKSLTLLNLAYQIKRYNRGFKSKDPTKIPCVVYLTMENSVTETIQRLFKICTGEDLKNHSIDEIEYMLKTKGELYLTGDSPIDLIIKYKPNRSVDTSYLYTLTEDLEDEGYEVICLMQDHIKRIRSTTNQQDIRLELGDVTNELKTFALIKDIPVITNSHLNRDGAKVIDEGASKSKADLIRMLGKANIGESLLMLDNTDVGLIINKEYDSEGNVYMAFKNIKSRVQILRDYICQPFYPENSIRLMEDLYMPVPLFKETLRDNPLNMISNTNIQKSNYTGTTKRIDDDDKNIYEYANKFSSINIANTGASDIYNLEAYNESVETIENEVDKDEKDLICPIYYENKFGISA